MISRRLWIASIPLAVLLLAGCRTTSTAGTDIAIGFACSAFKPIHWSSRDAEETRAEIIEHNAAWDELCNR